MQEHETIDGKDPVKDIYNAIMESLKGEYVSDSVKKERLELCKNCPNFTFTRQCKICLCEMDWKASLKKSACPMHKWGANNG